MSLCATQKIVFVSLIIALIDTLLVFIILSLPILAQAGVLAAFNVGVGWIITPYFKKWFADLKHQDSLLIDDLKTLLRETQFATIDYCHGHILKRDFREPQIKYPSKVERLYEKNGLATLRQHTKTSSSSSFDSIYPVRVTL